MSVELSAEQAQLVRQLRMLDPELPYSGFPEVPTSAVVAEAEAPSSEVDMFYEAEYDQQHAALRSRLMGYRRKSEQIYKVGELVKDYESKFGCLMEDKDRLVRLLQEMKGETSELVEKQKRLIDLTMKLKQCLEYYSYHDKHRFDFPCDVGCREMFENSLQSTLSELADGIQFFQENAHYSQAKRYLSQFEATRSKVLSFSKSFLIKLFNKESQFMTSHCKLPLTPLLDSLYPKSRVKFITAFLLHFPQFHPHLTHILGSVKENATKEDLSLLQNKELLVNEFQLNRANLALIGYLQLNVPGVYKEAVLHFLSYYRTNLHQNLLKATPRQAASVQQLFRNRFTAMVYMLSCEYAYLKYCTRAHNQQTEEIQKTVSQLALVHMEELSKIVKDARNTNPVELCQLISTLREQLDDFLQKHQKEEYQSYAFGCVSQFVSSPQDHQFLKRLFDTHAQRCLVEMETMCFNSLPSLAATRSKGEVEQQVRQLAEAVPKLRYCENHSEKYLIGVLDTLVKSIKEVNGQIQSRFECYVWNLEVFFNIKEALRDVRSSLVKKELKLDVHNSANLIDRFRRIARNQSFLQYAQDVFNVIKTGMPVINELTLDFAKFIHEHCQLLQTQFIRDILFIYAKNMIEFLQRLAQAPTPEAKKEVCQPQVVTSLYSGYSLSIQNYTKDAKLVVEDWRKYRLGQHTEPLLMQLLGEVYQRLFDMMDKFYTSTSQHSACTETFLEIDELKQKYKRLWVGTGK